MKNLLLSLFGLFTIVAFAQDEVDAKSQKILNELSAKTKNYKSIQASFNSTMENKQANLNIKQKGNLILEGTSYILNLEEYKIINDGKTNWTIAIEDEEVIVENAADLMEENNIDPSKIFTIWEDGFKHKYEKETTINGVVCHLIKLFPKDAANKNFHTLALYIDKAKMEIKKVKVSGKSGETYTYDVSTFSGSTEPSNASFAFKTSEYPDFDIIDNR